jgi:hypothetical protein
MAIEIIKRGTPPAEVVLTATCHQCKSELKFKTADGTSCSDPRDGSVTVTVKCPVCGGNVHGYPKSN